MRIEQRGWPKSDGGRGYQLIHLTVNKALTPINLRSPTPEPTYKPKVVREVFRNSDYALLSEDEQGRLAEILERAELLDNNKT